MALPLSLGQIGEMPSIAEDSGRGNKNALKAKRNRLVCAGRARFWAPWPKTVSGSTRARRL
jgi:hypothetical protein